MLRRIVPIAVIVSLLGAMCPSPALALSTQGEIAIGRSYDQQIVESSVVETDPLLNQWVNSVSQKLWAETARKDVPYNIKILQDNEINAFSTMGGYVYVNSGLLDFVQSDDELAGVIGHETGHIERRHAVTMQTKANILSILLGVASMFSPFIYNFGNLLQAGAMAKMSRLDELQADRYGLLLMARAGYDPEAMLTMQQHLAAVDGEHNDLVTKYFEDHPGGSQRIAHLLGYPELDPTKTNSQERLVWALHDLDEARYNVANIELSKILKSDPNNQQALLALGQTQLALGLTSKSEQTLGELAQSSSPEVKAAAQERINALRSMEVHRVDLTRPNLGSLQEQMKSAAAVQSQAAAQIAARHDEGHNQLKSLQNRLQAIEYEIPDFSRVEVKHGSRLEAIQRSLNGMARSVNSAIQNDSQAIDEVGSLDVKTLKPSGLLKENADILSEMQSPLQMKPIPSDSVAMFPSYPQMLGDLTAADSDMERAVDAGRAAAMQLDDGLGDLDAFIKRLQQTQLNAFSDIGQMDYEGLVPYMQKAQQSLGQAAVSASQADQLYNMARSHQLEARISLLGLGTSPQRYSTLRKAINVRWNIDDLSYIDMLHDNVTPGELTAASIVAADFKTTPQAIIRQAHETHRSIVDVANARGMHAEALEIFLGLIWLDYTDSPQSEQHPEGVMRRQANGSDA
ncbi:MAG TPA: M48 family metalloprotease [Candidatus Baltobacteraceae bacterium]|nr:M48 family metalloprotease [Candidatus Baltobacteraceae bacterium]